MIEHSIQLGTMITKQLRIKRKTLLEKLVDMEKEDVIKCAESAITSYYLPTSEFERSKFKALRKFESNENFDKLKKEERYILIQELLRKNIVYYYKKDRDSVHSIRIESYLLEKGRKSKKKEK